MITFQAYYILQESLLTSISPSKLGFITSMRELPNDCPYGFWVDRHGNFITVSPYEHERCAKKIIETAEALTRGVRKSSYYGEMFKSGMMRVVTGSLDGCVYFELRGEIPTNSQMRFLKFVKDLYDKKDIKFN